MNNNFTLKIRIVIIAALALLLNFNARSQENNFKASSVKSLNYCTPYTGSPCYLFLFANISIEDVSFGTLNFTGGDCSPNGYENRYSLDSGTVVQGQSYTFTVSIEATLTGDYLLAWVDWNNDGIFTDSTELIMPPQSLGFGGSSASYTVVVPADAPAGPHTLRVRSDYGDPSANPDPCKTAGAYGDTKDFKIIVNSSVQCNTPLLSASPVNSPLCLNNGNASSFSASFSAGDKHIIYQWQVSSDNGSTWNNITSAGANPLYSNYTDTVATPFTATLGLANVILSNNGLMYQCFASDTTGKCTVISNTATLFVDTIPVSSTVFTTLTQSPGDTVNYSVSLNEPGNFIYQWTKSGEIIPGATNSILTNTNLVCNDSGLYRCSVKNTCDSINVNVSRLYMINCVRFKFAVSGNVVYDNADSTPMSSKTPNTITTVYLESKAGDAIDSINTDDTGYYIFLNLPNDTFKLNVKTNKPWGGVNPIDALLANRTYIGLYTITDSLKRRAADVNNDGKINPIDALLINRRYIALVHKFTIPDWLFEIPPVVINGADLTKNIIAICAGDVNGSYIPPARVISHQLSVNTNISINLNSDNLTSPVDIPVYLNDNVELGAIGIKFKVQSPMFKVIEIKSDIAGLIYTISGDEINIAWTAIDDGYTITPDKPLFWITVKCSSLQLPASNFQPPASSLQPPASNFQITSESVIADFNINQISTDKLFIPRLIFNTQHSTFNIFPNPFNDITNIEYNIPEDMNVKIDVYNVLGEKVAAIANIYQIAGQYTVKFDGSDLKQGLYYCRFEADNSNSSYSKTNIIILTR